MSDRFVWYELMTTDTGAAKAFYGSVIGWGTREAPVPGIAYTLFTNGEAPVAGLMELPEEPRKAGARPSWIGYVGVADVDATVERVRQLGGTVHVAPTDIPEVGRFAIIADPQMATLALFRYATPDDQGQQPPAGTPGHVGWHELLADDWEKAFAFYDDLFGWRKAEAMDMGEMGIYQIFASGDQSIGGMYSKPPMVPAPFWLYYFNVDDIDAAVARVTAGGGQVLNGPMEVPGGGWIIQGKDPQGALFALFGRRAA